MRSLLLTLKTLSIISSFNATSMSSEDFQDLARMQIPQQQASSHGAQKDFASGGERYVKTIHASDGKSWKGESSMNMFDTKKLCSKFTVFNFKLHGAETSLPSTPTLGPIYCHCFFGTYTRSVSRIFVLQIWSSMLEELQQLPTHSQSDYFCHCSVIFEVFPQMLHQSPRNTVPSCITLSKWSISSVSLVRPQRYNVPSLQWTNTQTGETQSSDIHTVLRKQNKKLHCLHLLSLWNRNMLRSRPTNWLVGQSLSMVILYVSAFRWRTSRQHSTLCCSQSVKRQIGHCGWHKEHWRPPLLAEPAVWRLWGHGDRR